MTSPSASLLRIRRSMIAGLAGSALLVFGVGGWASTAPLSGALIVPGSLVVDSNVKKVQHPTGGVVGEILVRDGDHVRTGDVLVRLDETIPRANRAIYAKGLDEALARKSRLEAERDVASSVSFPKVLTERLSDTDVLSIVKGESKLFELRRAARAGQKSQLMERIGQLEEEIRGLTAQESAKAEEVDLIQRELQGVRELFAKNLIQISRLTALERDTTRIRGERAQLMAATAQAKGKISEIQLQILQISQDLGTEVARDLREIEGKVGELIERKVQAEDQLKRIEIRAPQDGTILDSHVHTVGGVIPPGDTIMMVVPNSDSLAVEARVNPQDIDQVKIEQPALLRLSAFNQRTTPEIEGEVSRISPDITTDPRTGQGYYTIRIAIKPEELARIGTLRLLPGMPVESFVKTGDRTMLAYLSKPLHDQFMRAFRER